MRDLKQLKRSAKHFNLASGAFMPRARARLDIHLSVSSFFNLSYPSAVYSSSYPLDARSQTRRVGNARTTSVRRENRDEGWLGRVASRREAEDARDGPTSIERGQEKCEEDRKEPREPRGGSRTAAAVAAAGMA